MKIKNVPILEIGAEGGSIKLLGRSHPNGWRFRVSTNEDYGEDTDGTPLRSQSESDWVISWYAALGFLDKYPWHRLHPLFVHPQFRKLVWEAVRQSLVCDEVLGQHRRQCPNCENGLLGLKRSRFGGFIGCSNYPECKFTRQLITEAARPWFRVCFPRPSPRPRA